MSGRYLPRIVDFFPTTRRGHGSTHPTERVTKTGQHVRNACICVNPACSLLRRQRDGETRGEAHEDQYANAADWKAERGFHEDTPLEECR